MAYHQLDFFCLCLLCVLSLKLQGVTMQKVARKTIFPVEGPVYCLSKSTVLVSLFIYNLYSPFVCDQCMTYITESTEK